MAAKAEKRHERFDPHVVAGCADDRLVRSIDERTAIFDRFEDAEDVGSTWPADRVCGSVEHPAGCNVLRGALLAGAVLRTLALAGPRRAVAVQ